MSRRITLNYYRVVSSSNFPTDRLYFLTIIPQRLIPLSPPLVWTSWTFGRRPVKPTLCYHVSCRRKGIGTVNIKSELLDGYILRTGKDTIVWRFLSPCTC